MRAMVMLLAVLAMAGIPVAAQQQKAVGSFTRSASSKSNAAPSSPININTASQAQFESLPGIGPKVAQRIVEYRQKNGQFKKVEDLMNVKGIGEKSFLKLKPYLAVSEKATNPGTPQR